jgi:hypothetical protein
VFRQDLSIKSCRARHSVYHHAVYHHLLLVSASSMNASARSSLLCPGQKTAFLRLRVFALGQRELPNSGGSGLDQTVHSLAEVKRAVESVRHNDEVMYLAVKKSRNSSASYIKDPGQYSQEIEEWFGRGSKYPVLNRYDAVRMIRTVRGERSSSAIGKGWASRTTSLGERLASKRSFSGSGALGQLGGISIDRRKIGLFQVWVFLQNLNLRQAGGKHVQNIPDGNPQTTDARLA